MNSNLERPPLAQDTVEGFLAALGSDRPAPSGGAAAALACALGAALAEMAAGLCGAAADAGLAADELRERARAARAAVVRLADEDAAAYARVLTAQRLPRTDGSRKERVRSALAAAADPPLEIAVTAAVVAELAAELAEAGNPRLRGDATAGALLAEAAARAAARLVEINLARVADGDLRVRRALAAADRALAAREHALALDPAPGG